MRYLLNKTELSTDCSMHDACSQKTRLLHMYTVQYSNNNCFTAILYVTCDKNSRILLEQSFTACIPSLTATNTSGLRRRHYSSPQQRYLCHLQTVKNIYDPMSPNHTKLLKMYQIPIFGIRPEPDFAEYQIRYSARTGQCDVQYFQYTKFPSRCYCDNVGI